MNINDQNFQEEVLGSDQPVLVDFFSDWCPPCKMLAPIIEELANEYQGKIKIDRLNIEAGPGIAQKYEIRSIPTLIFFKKGQEVKRLVGLRDKEYLKKEIDSILILKS